jgi:hypothetical protein
MSVPYRVQRLLDGGMLAGIESSDEDVAALWEKTVASAREARSAGNSLPNRYVLGYQALLQMATSILSAAGYRTQGAQAHHVNSFYAVSALEVEGLEDIHVWTDEVRKLRSLSAYGPGSPTPGQLDRLLKLVETALPEARKWLAAKRPAARLARLDEPRG